MKGFESCISSHEGGESCLIVDYTSTHLCVQADICGLSEIKYDFVGRIEDLDHGVDYVMDQLHAEKLDSFTLGKAAHPTAANSVLQELYNNKVSFIQKFRMFQDAFCSCMFSCPVHRFMKFASCCLIFPLLPGRLWGSKFTL